LAYLHTINSKFQLKIPSKLQHKNITQNHTVDHTQFLRDTN